MFSHAIFMPGMPGWLDKFEKDLETLKPDSFKGYTIGDNTNKHLARHPWHLDDEKLLYPFYEKLVKASKSQPSLANVCIHKGLFPPSTTKQFPDLVKYADVRDVAKAAKDWPQLNFIIYHSGFRYTGGAFMDGWEQFEKTGRIDWVTDLAEIPEKYGVKNVYGDLGQIFAQSTVAEPRLCAAMMGQLVKGLGADHIVWGSDAVWTGAPQWQIEALRRLEIPEDMQKKYGFKPLGAADGPVKSAIFGNNSARLYNFRPAQRAALDNDFVAVAKAKYDEIGDGRTNLAYGYVNRGA
jgi:predicted TIM-barrel fold metal-dependent hydrolase